MAGEWVWFEEGDGTKLPPTNNHILGHVVARLETLAHPPNEKQAKVQFPDFRLKACVLGKLCSGKSSCLAKIAQAHGIHVLSIHELINKALNAYRGTAATQELSDSVKEPKGESYILPQDFALFKLPTQAINEIEAGKAVTEGNDVPFELLVKIVIEAIQKIPANSGWILDGFPLNINQAHLLEKALGGSVEEEQCIDTNSQMNLAVDPDPPIVPPSPPPALDLALLLDISDECAVTRAVNLTCAAATDSTRDYIYMSQIPQRVVTGKTENLIRIDANVDEEELVSRVESVLLQVKRPLQEVVTSPANEVVVSDEGTNSQSMTSSLGQSSNQELTANLQSTESSKSLNTEKDGNGKTQMSMHNLESSKMVSLTNESSSTYFDRPLPPGVPEVLHLHWKNVCEMYVDNIKAVLQELRLENILIKQHISKIKEEFKDYLGRPDLRQEIVSHWQKDFNSVSDDMRSDEETKAELHLRLQELCERLWNICEKRKEENEQEMAAVMEDGWLSDHTALLVNYHSILMQVELDRFQDIFCILKKYYLSESNKPLLESPPNLTKISLLDTSSILVLETQSQQNEQDQPQKKLLNDYEEAVRAINSLLPAAAQQREEETKPNDKAQEKPQGADKSSKKSAKKKKGPASPPPASNPEPPEVKPQNEAAKMRMSLVKGHGLNLVDFIQRNAEETSCCMKSWLKEHFQIEMKSIEQLAEVVRHHIEFETKLLNELVLDCTNFSLNGDYLMEALPPPSWLLSCLEFLAFLKNIITASKGRNTLPETWTTMTETQMMEIVTSLKDKHDLVDWRRFLLGCALPWPSPSVTQLLDALRHFKAVDVERKGYISEKQYLQTQLWFTNKTVEEDPSKPLPSGRLLNLFKFFFQMFADHYFSPPRLNYTSMLLYLSADPNLKQGFIRALSVIVGQHLRQTSSTQLVKIREVPECSSPEVDVDFTLPEGPSSDALLGNQKVSVDALLTVLNHSSSIKDRQTEHTKLVGVYKELGYRPEDSITFSVLSTHSFIQHLMETQPHQLVSIHDFLNNGGEC
ncbi:hypothetical protein WMY93_004420 [Mugilogobius chulae]|uniref:SPEF2 C-terminal domain-containing protein n=1 Tax=Mugilogobius chulae TaxID=88201 RepID=A0AAW0PR20_9GOBI